MQTAIKSNFTDGWEKARELKNKYNNGSYFKLKDELENFDAEIENAERLAEIVKEIGKDMVIEPLIEGFIKEDVILQSAMANLSDLGSLVKKNYKELIKNANQEFDSVVEEIENKDSKSRLNYLMDKQEELDRVYSLFDYKNKKALDKRKQKVEELIEKYAPKEEKNRLITDLTDHKKITVLTKQEKEKAIARLSRPDLLYHLKKDLDLVIAGENEAKLLVYLACASSKLSEFIQPINILINSPSASGKTYLMTHVSQLFPKEKVMQATRFSSRGIDYIQGGLDGKIIAIEEHHAMPDDVRRSMLPTMWKSKTKTYVTVVKDGKRVTKPTEVLGNPTYLLASVKDFWEEEVNRGILVRMDISEEQNKRIRELKEKNSLFPSKTNEEFENLAKEYVNNHYAIEPTKVVMPFGGLITDLISEAGGAVYGRTEEKLESMVQTIANLHQYNEGRNKINIEGEDYLVSSLSDLYNATRIVNPFFENKFNIDGLEVDMLSLNNRISELSNYDPEFTEKIGISYNDKKEFDWDNYQEKTIDPITGEKMQIYIKQLDNEKGVLKLEKIENIPNNGGANE